MKSASHAAQDKKKPNAGGYAIPDDDDEPLDDDENDDEDEDVDEDDEERSMTILMLKWKMRRTLIDKLLI